MHRKVAQPPHLPKILRSGAFCALRQRSRTMCELLLKAEESWRLNALSEAANAGFWLAHLVSRYLCCRLISYKMNNLLIINIFSLRCEFEWQSRLLLIGQKDKVIEFFSAIPYFWLCGPKVEKWRLEHIPEIQREDMAANFLFK